MLRSFLKSVVMIAFDGDPPMSVQRFMRLNPKRRKSRRSQEALKARIKFRLANEDYTCRMPKYTKPRIRYKLTLHQSKQGRFPFLTPRNKRVPYYQ